MKKNRSAGILQEQAKWRRWTAAIVVTCMIAGTPVQAQEPSANQATLNFVGADIDAVIKAIGHYTRTTFVIDPRVKGTINLVSEKPVSKAQSLELLASALRLQGYAMVRTDGVIKVVPEADAKLQAAPTKIDKLRGDMIATEIFHLNYESAASLVPILRPLISPNNTISANPGTNSVVITDYVDNLRRLGKIIAGLDAPAVAGIDVVPIRYGIASDLANIVNRLLEPSATATGAQGAPGAAADSGRVAVLADSRTNSLIVRAPSAARANFAKALIAKLDQPTAQPGNVHVVYLRNADAVRLAQTLRAVVASETGTAGGGGTQQQFPGQTQQTPTTPQQGQGAIGGSTAAGFGAGATSSSAPTPASLPTGGPGGFIQADPATNALIITASETVYRNLRAVIDQLDARRAQVYVESLIVEVSANKAAEFGIQWLGLSGNSESAYRVGGGTVFSTAGENLANQLITHKSTGNVLPPGNGLTVGLFRQINGQLTLGALARALETDTNANILSVPNLITLDNEEARIIVGQNVPFITGQYTTPASGGTAGVNPFQTVERRDIGLALRVRPQVSEGGLIKLAIYQESSSIQDTTNAAGIITNKRSIESNVLVDDGQIIVLGGLIQDQVTDGWEKVPGLGDIPVIGGLFKFQTRKRTKTNLMVFLRPTVIRTTEQSVAASGDRYDYVRGIGLDAQPAHTLVLPDTGSQALPPLQDGRPVGGLLLNMPPTTPPVMPSNPEPYLPPNPAPTAPSNPAPVAPSNPAPPAPPNQEQSRPQ